MSANPKKKYPELLVDLASTVCDALARQGIDAACAARVGHEAAELVRQRWGGHLVYVPKGKLYSLSERDLQIWSEFNGRNIQELATKYGVCDTQIYKVLAKVRASEIRRRQSDLFSRES